jgi:predicted transcriptional regulator of viral defense system
MKSIGHEYRRKLAAVIQATKGIITPHLVSEILELSLQESGRILSRWSQQGWVKRIKHGVYIPIPVEDLTGDASIEDPWVVATHLFSPGYIGGFSAIKHWDFSEQLFEITSFFTSKKIKEKQPIIGNSRFQLKHIAPYKIFGTKIVWRDSVKVLVADPSKTIVDLLDDPGLVGGMRVVQDIFQEYKISDFFDFKILMSYAEKMQNKTIFKRLGFLLEYMQLDELVKDNNLQNKISSGYSMFDPTVKNTCYVREWNLKVPAVWVNKND